MDQNQCSAAGTTCRIALRSHSIPRACSQQGDPCKITENDPAVDNRPEREGLASSGDPMEKLQGQSKPQPLCCVPAGCMLRLDRLEQGADVPLNDLSKAFSGPWQPCA